jgi:prepilin-type N-terminal cleavage/methylation domain-containing protein
VVKSENGFSLVEVMIAMFMMGIVFVAFLCALSTASTAVSIADERAAMESLARTEMEYARSQPYSAAPWNYTVTSSDRSSTDPPDKWYDSGSNPPLLDSSYAGYTVTVSAAGLIDPNIDNEIQKITVTVAYQGGERTITLMGYRSMR